MISSFHSISLEDANSSSIGSHTDSSDDSDWTLPLPIILPSDGNSTLNSTQEEKSDNSNETHNQEPPQHQFLGVSLEHSPTADLSLSLSRMDSVLFTDKKSVKTGLLTQEYHKEHVYVELKPKQHAQEVNFSSNVPPVLYEDEVYIFRVSFSSRVYQKKSEYERRLFCFNFFAPFKDMMHVRFIREGTDPLWPVAMFALRFREYEVCFKRTASMIGEPSQIVLSDGYETVWSSSLFHIEEMPLSLFGKMDCYWQRYTKEKNRSRSVEEGRTGTRSRGHDLLHSNIHKLEC